MNDPMFLFPNVGAYVRGSPDDSRQLVQHRELLTAYTNDDLDTGHEAYLSHFIYGPEMQSHYFSNSRSVKGFDGPTWAKWIVFDIDRPNLEEALNDVRKLTQYILQRYPDVDGTLPVYFSGGKGFHVYLELVHEPPPAVGFNLICRTLAETLAAGAGVKIDSAIYDANRILRLPNSRHPKTGLFKRRIDADDLFKISLAGILERCREPAGDGICTVGDRFAQIEEDWNQAVLVTAQRTTARATIRQQNVGGDTRLAKHVLDFLRFGAEQGDRHQTLFQCAAYLTEQNAPSQFVRLLLTEAATDLGLTPSDVTRQIDCGIQHARKQSEGGPR